MRKLELFSLRKSHGKEGLFAGISYSFPDKGLIAIVGDSGSGKTTLLDIVAGLDVGYEGTVLLMGKSLKSLSEKERSILRLREIGYIRQSYDLLESETAFENVCLPLKAASEDSAYLMKEKALSLLATLGLEGKADQVVNTLSGGEKQRVALARALTLDPPILLADEPTGALDQANAEIIYAALASLGKKILVLLVSHDLNRTRKYADVIITLRNGLFVTNPNEEKESEGSLVPATTTRSGKRVPHVSLSSWLRHSHHLNQNRKWRSFLTRSILSFSFIALALALYVSRDLADEVNGAFSSLVGSGLVVMEPSNRGENTFGTVVAASEEEVGALASEHQDFISDYGVSYLASFENYFPDLQIAYFPLSDSKFYIDNLTVRTANDFLWLDEAPGDFYPERPSFLENDQIVLGLPYQTMAALCLRLQIVRTYESLGDYLIYHGLRLVYELENVSWRYYDSQILEVRAVTESETPRIFHDNHRWNTYLLEERMRFPTSDSPDYSLPWIMQKVFYLERSVSPELFHERQRSEPAFRDYVLDPPSSTYVGSLLKQGMASDLPRYYVYLADKHSLDPFFVESLGRREEMAGFLYGSEGTYMAYPDSLMAGFASPFYAAGTMDGLNQVLDVVTDQSEEESSLEVILPSGVVSGHYSKPASSCLTLSNDFSSLDKGRKPLSLLEVTLSEKLDEELGHPSEIYVAGEVGEETVAGRIKRDYRTSALKVVGVTKSLGEVLGVISSWPLDFFGEALGMSGFLLEPTRALFSLKDASKSTSMAHLLANECPEYRFTDPSERVASSVSEVLGYVDLALTVATAICLALSLLLLAVVSLLSVLENEREGRMLFTLGLSRDDIADSYVVTVSLHLAGAVATASLTTVALEFLIHQILAENFGGGGRFRFDFIPLGAIGLIAIVAMGLLTLATSGWIHRRDFRKEGR